MRVKPRSGHEDRWADKHAGDDHWIGRTFGAESQELNLLRRGAEARGFTRKISGGPALMLGLLAFAAAKR